MSLVVCPTPIGNLEDITLRALSALRDADVVACEDTRRTRVLLDHVGSRAPMTSYHDHNERSRTGSLLDRVAQGATVVLVCDAGTPGLADPGFRLVREATERGLRVDAVPGPTAALSALVLSGLPMDRFAFEGFLPRRGSARRARLDELRHDPRTLVFYVSPHRARDDLAAMAEAFGDRPAALARELTKLHEEVWRSGLAELAVRAADTGVRGEVTVVVAGASPDAEVAPEAGDLVDRVRELVATGMSRKDAIAAVAAAAKIPKREVYQAVVDA